LTLLIIPMVLAACSTVPVGPSSEAQRPSERGLLTGEAFYMADAAGFRECASGVTYPVAMEGNYLEFERACTRHGANPDSPVLMVVKGRFEKRPRVERPGKEITLVVEKVERVEPGNRCSQIRKGPALSDTKWRILSLMGKRIRAGKGVRGPMLLLKDDAPHRYMATVGCNRLMGSYWARGEELGFSPPASTRMECPEPLAKLEKALAKVLTETRGWRIEKGVLTLLNMNGGVIARLAPEP
jgi:heat shock protein HslJ